MAANTFSKGHWCFFFDSAWSHSATYRYWIDDSWDWKYEWHDEEYIGHNGKH
jgi:hypothetical protein